MLKHLLPLIPAHRLYCEPFGGGLAVFLAHEQSPVEVINDINRDLVSFYRCCKWHLDPLLDEIDLVLNSRQELRDYLQQPGLTELQRAGRWFVRHRISFGGMGGQFAVARSQALNSRAKNLVAIRRLSDRLDRTTIENLTWERCLALYDGSESFFFLDPPYFDGAGDAYEGWTEADLGRFAEAVRKLKGSWIVTFQDCEQIHAAFDGCRIRRVDRDKGIAKKPGIPGKGTRYREVIITPEPARRSSKE